MTGCTTPRRSAWSTGILCASCQRRLSRNYSRHSSSQRTHQYGMRLSVFEHQNQEVIQIPFLVVQNYANKGHKKRYVVFCINPCTLIMRLVWGYTKRHKSYPMSLHSLITFRFSVKIHFQVKVVHCLKKDAHCSPLTCKVTVWHCLLFFHQRQSFDVKIVAGISWLWFIIMWVKTMLIACHTGIWISYYMNIWVCACNSNF